MNILLIYFTGTFNTRFITEMVRNEFIKYGHSVEMVEVNYKTESINTDNYDLIGLGYPIYAFNSPLPFNRFLKTKVKFKKGQNYFIYKNSGETLGLNNSSSRIIKRRMKHQKLNLTGEYHFVMPYNIHFPFDENFIKEMIEKDHKLCELMVYNLCNGIYRTIKSNIFYDFLSFCISIQKIGGPINSFFYRVDKTKCIKCHKCIDQCPSDNIYEKKGKIAFHHRCDMCMRCSFYCPSDAIKIGFLQNWKVNHYYHLPSLEQTSTDRKPYITSESKGFYKYFIKYFAQIDSDYSKLLKIKEEQSKNGN